MTDLALAMITVETTTTVIDIIQAGTREEAVNGNTTTMCGHDLAHHVALETPTGLLITETHTCLQAKPNSKLVLIRLLHTGKLVRLLVKCHKHVQNPPISIGMKPALLQALILVSHSLAGHNLDRVFLMCELMTMCGLSRLLQNLSCHLMESRRRKNPNRCPSRRL